MSKLLLAAPLVMGLMSGCGPSEREIPTLRVQAEQAVADFDTVYGCYIPIEVNIEEIDIDTPLSTDQNTVTGGTATKGLITINPVVEDIEKNIPGAIKHTATHETSHACNIGELDFETSYELVAEGIRMVGSSGLSAVGVEVATDQRLTFSFIEEGVAELLAYNITGVEGTSVGHTEARKTTQRLLQENDITLQKVQDFQENSDLIGLIALLVNKTPEEVTANDISYIFSIYLKDFAEASE